MKIDALERDLPSATLLLGPDLTSMVQHAIGAVFAHGVIPADRFLLRHVSAADARNLVKFAQTAPFGPFKVVIAVLDGSTPRAQNILLKVLEEPPLLGSGKPAVRFILVSTSLPLPTITSRCQVITVPSESGDGEPDQQVVRQVTDALKYALAQDLNSLDRALAGWGEEHHAVLSLQLAEAASGESPHGINQVQARRLLGALGQYSGAHPRLAAHAAFVTVLSDRESHA